MASITGIAGYVGVIRPIADASLSAVVAVYLSGLLWVMGTAYRFVRRRRVLAKVQSCESDSKWVELTVKCRSRISVFPGCYFYVYYPRRYGFKSLHLDAFVDNFPLPVAWIPEKSKGNLITFIISKDLYQRGKSKGSDKSKVEPFKSGMEILLEGPYGHDVNATARTTTVLAAHGPGIIGLLSFASSQVRHEKDREYQVGRRGKRRLNLLWVLEHVSQQDVVGNKLRELQKIDLQSVRRPSSTPALVANNGREYCCLAFVPAAHKCEARKVAIRAKRGKQAILDMVFSRKLQGESESPDG